MDTPEQITGEPSSAANPAPVVLGSLVPGPRGGSLRVGNPGNKGGSGRPKESYRKRMRRLLKRSLEAIERDLNLLEASDWETGTLANPTPNGPQRGPMLRSDVIRIAAMAAKFGIGTQDEKEIQQTRTQFIIRVPERKPLPTRTAKPLQIIASNADQIAAVESQSSAVIGETA